MRFAGHYGDACAVGSGVTGAPLIAEVERIGGADGNGVGNLLEKLFADCGLRDGEAAGISGRFEGAIKLKVREAADVVEI